MSHRELFQTVSGCLRHQPSGAKIQGDLKGFVPSDRIVRYLREVQRRGWNPNESFKPRSAH